MADVHRCVWHLTQEWIHSFKQGSDLPAGLTELLHVDGAAQGDDEHGQVLRGQAVVTNNCIQDLQGNLWKRDTQKSWTLPCESTRSNPHLAHPGNLLEVKRDDDFFFKALSIHLSNWLMLCLLWNKLLVYEIYWLTNNIILHQPSWKIRINPEPDDLILFVKVTKNFKEFCSTRNSDHWPLCP